jgi:hypothetical protein
MGNIQSKKLAMIVKPLSDKNTNGTFIGYTVVDKNGMAIGTVRDKNGKLVYIGYLQNNIPYGIGISLHNEKSYIYLNRCGVWNHGLHSYGIEYNNHKWKTTSKRCMKCKYFMGYKLYNTYLGCSFDVYNNFIYVGKLNKKMQKHGFGSSVKNNKYHKIGLWKNNILINGFILDDKYNINKIISKGRTVKIIS